MNKKKVLLILVVLIGMVITILLIYNNNAKEPSEDNKPLINKEAALKLIKENYKIDNNIYQYDKKEGVYHIIKSVNNPSVEYWVHEYTGDIIIQSGMSSNNIINNE